MAREEHGHAGEPHQHESGLGGWLAGLLDHGHGGHAHGATVAESSERGIWALKVSLAGLGLTALLQVAIVAVSGSVALLADTLHNFADAATSLPLWLAFELEKRGATRRFTYGYGRAEDLAGIIIVAVILFSAGLAGYEAVQRLIEPQPVTHLWWVAAAAVIGFIGNEAVALFRIRVGREIGSAALVADGQHSRIDGLTSLAVLLGALGVAVGLPILDPLVGLAITGLILLIVRDAARRVLQRLMDGIEPEILAAVEQAPLRVDGVRDVHRARARWLGHRVHADLHVTVDRELTVEQAHGIVEAVEAALAEQVPAFGGAQVHVCPAAALTGAAASAAGARSGAGAPR